MPLVAWLLYQDATGWWWAMSLGAVIASTDYVDGYLARKHGPTELGGLLDPIADKVFIALTYLPLCDLGFFPATAVALVFVRELVVTALRSAFYQRGMTMKTSYVAKAKTWSQMQGMMTLVVLALVDSRTFSVCALIGFTVGVVGIGVAVWVKRRRLWRPALFGAGFFGLGTVFYATLPLMDATRAALWMFVAVTVASGVDYLWAIPRLIRARAAQSGDIARMALALALPVLAVVILRDTEVAFGLVGAVVAIELTVGGLDNLLSHHGAQASGRSWGIHAVLVAGLLVLALCATSAGVATAAAIGATIASLAFAVREFWRGRAYYLTALD